MLDFLYKNLFEILTVIAILVGPFIGIWTQKKIERNKERKSKQLHIFRALMAEHTENSSAEYVAALNLIPIDFSNKNKKEKPVIIAWRTLLAEHDNTPNRSEYKNDAEYLNADQIAEDKAYECHIDLIFQISKCLGYDFERVDLKAIGYVPTGHDEKEDNLEIIREELVKLLTGKKPLDINVKD